MSSLRLRFVGSLQAEHSTDRAVAGDAGVLLSLLKHNRVVAALARRAAWARNRGLERVIFTATTGRSGTTTLTRLFAAVPSCRSLHEPWPPMSGEVLHAASYGDVRFVRRAFHRSKAVNILRAAAGHRYYFEANHCFVKTFAELAAEEFGDRLAVVHLVRPAIEVAMSIFRLREEPGTNVGNFWWLDHRAPSNLIQVADLLDSDRLAHPFYKALWYWHEVEARIAALRTRLPALRMVRFETAELHDKDKVLRLFAALGIACDAAQIEPLIGGILNQREEQKCLSPLPLAQAESMLLRFHDAVSRRGIEFPHFPSSKPWARERELREPAVSA
ncbi:MAG TPA: hypothetical protein VFX20_15215 [Steroidobacteraceae bacterium]|nr:hypothetical protein [Steroidobacteraceae bacterium]